MTWSPAFVATVRLLRRSSSTRFRVARLPTASSCCRSKRQRFRRDWPRKIDRDPVTAMRGWLVGLQKVHDPRLAGDSRAAPAPRMTVETVSPRRWPPFGSAIPCLNAAIDALDLDSSTDALAARAECRLTCVHERFTFRTMADFFKILQQAQQMQGRLAAIAGGTAARTVTRLRRRRTGLG